jgi:hypothetical protein
MANEPELQKIVETLNKLTDRLASLETKTAAALAPTKAVVATSKECIPDNGNGNKTVNNPTASDDAEYWAAAFAAGLSLSQQRGFKGWQSTTAALLPALTRTLDESKQGNTSVIAPALAPAAISGAAYFLGRALLK